MFARTLKLWLNIKYNNVMPLFPQLNKNLFKPMSTKTDVLQLKSVSYGQWLAQHPVLWQMDLLNEERLAKFSQEREVNFRAEHIKQLWQLRLLQADLNADYHLAKTDFRVDPNTGQAVKRTI